jgi:hypothetical protein
MGQVMSQHYSDPARANDAHALPDVEVWASWWSVVVCGTDGRVEAPYEHAYAGPFASTTCPTCGKPALNRYYSDSSERTWWWRAISDKELNGHGPYATEAEAVAAAQDKKGARTSHEDEGHLLPRTPARLHPGSTGGVELTTDEVERAMALFAGHPESDLLYLFFDGHMEMAEEMNRKMTSRRAQLVAIARDGMPVPVSRTSIDPVRCRERLMGEITAGHAMMARLLAVRLVRITRGNGNEMYDMAQFR